MVCTVQPGVGWLLHAEMEGKAKLGCHEILQVMVGYLPCVLSAQNCVVLVLTASSVDCVVLGHLSLTGAANLGKGQLGNACGYGASRPQPIRLCSSAHVRLKCSGVDNGLICLAVCLESAVKKQFGAPLFSAGRLDVLLVPFG